MIERVQDCSEARPKKLWDYENDGWYVPVSLSRLWPACCDTPRLLISRPRGQVQVPQQHSLAHGMSTTDNPSHRVAVTCQGPLRGQAMSCVPVCWICIAPMQTDCLSRPLSCGQYRIIALRLAGPLGSRHLHGQLRSCPVESHPLSHTPAASPPAADMGHRGKLNRVYGEEPGRT